MLRVTTHQKTGQPRILRLEGRLAGPWVAELARLAEQALAAGQGLALDLAGLTFVEPAGATLISRLRLRGVLLLGGSPFVAQLLQLGEDR